MSPVRRGKDLLIYNRLPVLRAEREMTRVQLAEAVEVNPQTIGASSMGGRPARFG
jgi:putative transcriptional regulator